MVEKIRDESIKNYMGTGDVTKEAVIRLTQVSADAILFQPNNIGQCPVFRVADSDLRAKLPTKAHPAFQIQHGRVIHDAGGRDQDP